MMFLCLFSIAQPDFSEVRVENSALALRVQQSPYVEEFAISNDGKVAFSYDNHINRFRLDANVAKADSEALLFRLIGGKATVRTTSQAATATNGSSTKGAFQNFLRVDDWSNVWFSYSTTNLEKPSRSGRHLLLLQVDERGKNPNKSWNFSGWIKAAFIGPNNKVFAVLDLEPLRSAVDSYQFKDDKLVRTKRQLLPKGMMAITYDPYTRRCVAETKGKAVVVHVPSGAKRELRKLGDNSRYTMARGRVYCQSGTTLYVDNGSRWDVYGTDRLLAVSNNGKQWLMFRSGQPILRTYKD